MPLAAADNPAEAKMALRREVLARRDALDPAARIEASLTACDIGGDCHLLSADAVAGKTVSGFMPIRSEIDPRPLMFQLATRGARLCLPVVIDRETIRFRELVRGADLVDTGFGTVGPPESAEVLDPDILLMPLSAFDHEGGRMGYGAGHYDRAIERLEQAGSEPVLIGIAFACQRVDRVPLEPHDRRLDAIITEEGIIVPEDGQ